MASLEQQLNELRRNFRDDLQSVENRLKKENSEAMKKLRKANTEAEKKLRKELRKENSDAEKKLRKELRKENSDAEKKLRKENSDAEKKLRKDLDDLQTAASLNADLQTAASLNADLLRKDLDDLQTAASLDANLWAGRYVKETAGEFIRFLLGRHLVKRPQNYFQGSDDLKKIGMAASKLGLEQQVLLERLRKLYGYRNEKGHCNTWMEMDSRIRECMDLFDRYKNLQRKFYLQYNFLRQAAALKTAFGWSTTSDSGPVQAG